jgi:hypothetical protein
VSLSVPQGVFGDSAAAGAAAGALAVGANAPSSFGVGGRDVFPLLSFFLLSHGAFIAFFRQILEVSR